MPKILSLIKVTALGWFMAGVYFLIAIYSYIQVLIDNSWGGGIFGSYFTLFLITLPWSLFIPESLESKIIIAVLNLLALLLNTAILFFIGRGISKLFIAHKYGWLTLVMFSILLAIYLFFRKF